MRFPGPSRCQPGARWWDARRDRDGIASTVLAGAVRFEEFEDRAWQLWEEIPERYKEGVDGLVVERGALPHPTLPDIYTLGECRTESYPSSYGGPETIRSVVVLYHGSFERLSRLDPAFDWEHELWETLTHELQHHLEYLADEDALEAMDYAVDENFKRLEGEPFDPFFYRSGEEVAEGVYRVDVDFFLEQEYPDGREPGEWIEFLWHGVRYRARRPRELGDVCFLVVEDGVEEWPPGDLWLVLVRRKRLGRSLRAWLAGERPEVREAGVEAEVVAVE